MVTVRSSSLAVKIDRYRERRGRADERLPFAQTAIMGVQHAVAMFGATVLMPILMGLDPNLSILMSGIGTLLFFFITGGRVPSYLGSSAAFVGVVIAATGFNGQGINPNISIALAIIACGLVYTVIGLVVMKIGTRWIERLMPPVVTGAVVMAIGLNLAPIAVKSVSASFDSWMAVMTVLCIGLVAVFTRGMIQRLLILVGLIVACLLHGDDQRFRAGKSRRFYSRQPCCLVRSATFFHSCF